jgi:hypothetical protein
MQYYKYPDEYSEIAGGTTYIEIDDGWSIRQITVNGAAYLASNVSHPDWGMILGDKQADYEDLAAEGEVIPISKQEFEAIWRAHLALRQAKWEAAKQVYSVGTTVHGYIQIFYPQGVIVNLGNDTLGVADHKACWASQRIRRRKPVDYS